MSSPYRILLLGGYGVFGSRIVKQLTKQNNLVGPLELFIGGRNEKKAKSMAEYVTMTTSSATSPLSVHGVGVDIERIGLMKCLNDIRPLR